MKKKTAKWILSFILTGSMIAFCACEDSEDKEEKGREAAAEFCECYKNHTKDQCLENLKDKYDSYEYESDDFIEAFNNASTCGIELIKERVKSQLNGVKNRPESLFFNVK